MPGKTNGEGAGRGRPAIDWEQAFLFYASLHPSARTYDAVAVKFGVSARTVERHGREERWQARLNEIQTEVAAGTNTSIAQGRVEQAMKTMRLIEASFIGYAEKLRSGEMRMVPGDLEKLNRLLGQLHEQLAATPSPARETPPAASTRTAEHVNEVIGALAETGALAALGLQPIPIPASDPDHEPDEEAD
jgi:hypothetical protein